MTAEEMARADTAIVLIAHGTISSLDDLPEFLANIRRGRAAPPGLVREMRRRYEAIGGRSPLLDITLEVAKKLEEEVDLPTRVAMRLFHPYPKDVIAKLVADGIRRIVTIPLAQYSAGVYGRAVEAAAREIDPELEVISAKNWGRTPELTQAFADAIEGALARLPTGEVERSALLFTAHSLPLSVVQGGDPYEKDFRASVEDVVAELRTRGAHFGEHLVAFQSQGVSPKASADHEKPSVSPKASAEEENHEIEWLGPDLRTSLDDLQKRGHKHVILAPIGFLADHVEILYDLDIEAKAWCEEELGMAFYRSSSLNAGDGLVSALARVAHDVMARPKESIEFGESPSSRSTRNEQRR